MAANGHSWPEDSERARRLLAVLDRALDAPPTERRALVRRALADDPDGQAEVVQWIEHAETGRGDLPAVFDLGRLEAASKAATVTHPAFRPGDTFKRWTVVTVLDRTPASEVYEGVGADGHRVVIKVVLAARWSPEAARRSRLEAYILSMVDDRGVVKYIDDGVVDEGPAIGLPYIVTALSEGEHADEWSKHAKASSAQIVEMIARAADAVYQANLHGAVHRDLKPSNIIVKGPAGDPSVFVIDFGVASMEATAVARDSLLSLQSTIVGTAAFMAPEQFLPATHLPDMRCDVYALAAVCYSMLAGRPPHAVEGLGVVEAARLKELAPPRLATVAPLRDCSPGVRRQLSRVLEVGLSPSPSTRFDSCKELSDSLRLALQGLPGTKDRPGPLARARAFARRQPMLTAAIVAVVLSLLAGIGGVVWQARIAMRQRDLAQQRLEDTQQFTRWIMTDLDESLAGLPGSVPLRRRLVEHADAHLNRLAASVHPSDRNTRALALDIAEARIRLGDVLGNTLFVNLGDARGAESKYREALAVLDSMHGKDRDPRVLWLTARCLEGLAMCLEYDHHEYRTVHQRAMDSYNRAADLSPANLDLRADRARAMVSFAWSSIYPERDWGRALPGLKAAVLEAERVLAMQPANDRSRRVLARCLKARGECRFRVGEYALAASDLEEALALWREVSVDGEPDTARMLRERDVTMNFGTLAKALGALGDRDGADAASADAVAMARAGFAVDQESQTMGRILELALECRAIAFTMVAQRRVAAGEALTPQNLHDLRDARRCLDEVVSLYERRAARGQIGPSEDYRQMRAEQIAAVDLLLGEPASR